MKKIRVRDRVRVDEHEETFVVLFVNEEMGWADLVCVERVGFLDRVPLEKIHLEKDRQKPPDHGRGARGKPDLK